MEDESSVIYGLEFQARALTTQVAETENIRFLVGTQSLKAENQVHHIDFDDENNLINKNVFLHLAGEIWHMSSSAADKSLLATCFNKTSESKAEINAAIWKLPSDFDSTVTEDHSSSLQPLKLVCELNSIDYGDMKSILWHPNGESDNVLGLADSHILTWNIERNKNFPQFGS